MDARIVRTRNSTDTTIMTQRMYIRNTGNAQGAAVNEASGEGSLSFSWGDRAAQAGDTYKLEARGISQDQARTLTFDTANNGVKVVAT